MTVEIVEELQKYGALQGGSAALVRRGKDDYYVVSTLNQASDGQPETLAWKATDKGEVRDFDSPIAGGKFVTRQQALQMLDDPSTSTTEGTIHPQEHSGSRS